MAYHTQYPSVKHLKAKAKKRVPHFAFDYLEGGCSDERSLARTTSELADVRLQEHFVRPALKNPDIQASFCGIDFDMPIGISPIGMQGLVWPDAPMMLARAAKKYNVPYILSTVSTHSIEEIAETSEGHALFQLYNPEDPKIRKDILERVRSNHYRALIVTADIASFGYRPRDISNGLSIPPKVSLANLYQACIHPTWSLNMLMAGGMPKLRTLVPYMAQDSLQGMAEFMNDKMMGGVSEDNLKSIRKQWDGPLVLKGVLGEHDIKKAIELGMDGVIVSNHGARQLDAGQTSISVLPELVQKYGKQIEITFDSGIQSGTDIACALASGAKFTFSGRGFTYGVAAMGERGAGHTIEMFERQLKQAMCQMGCKKIADLPKFLVK